MVGRQIASGLVVGSALALFALFLTTPRSEVAGTLTDWAPAPSPVAQGVGVNPAERGAGPFSTPQLPPQGPTAGLAAVAALPGAPWGADAELAEDTPAAADAGIPRDEFSVSPEELHPDAYLGAVAKQTVVRRAPDHDSPALGYLRAGTLLHRALIPASKKGCKEGWYRVEPRGYVCVGQAATLDVDHPVLQLASYAPDRSLPLPYLYGRSRSPSPALYRRLPSRSEQRSVERDLDTHLAKNFGSLWQREASTPPPSGLAGGEPVPLLFGQPKPEHDFFVGRALADSTFSFIDLFEAEGRYFGLTTDLSLVPLDRVTPVMPSEFKGIALGERGALPVAFVLTKGEQLFGGEPTEGQLRPLRAIEWREAFSLTGRKVEWGGALFLETSGGDYLRSQPRLRTIEPRGKLPKWAKADRTWLDVSLGDQTLVAYRGATPVYATLISSGRDGLADPETTHSTVQGLYLIHTKHVTATMSGDEADDEFDLRDVPYVQYFHGGYALHAAHWHDAFGTPKSHGCINLSPTDARYLFAWTEPPVPQRWHSALSRDGTLVFVHP